jgi:hypothetical protein
MTSTTTTGAGYTAEPGSLYASLVSYWKLDETSDGSGAVTRVDSVGTHNLTDTNTVLHSTSGKIGNCADIEKGNTESLVRANASAADLLGASGSWTFACWLKVETHANNNILASCWSGSGGDRAYRMVTKSTSETNAQIRFQATQEGSGGTIQTAGNTSGEQITLAAGTWYHYIAQHRNGTDIRMRVNNSAWIDTAFTGGVSASNTDWSLGQTFDGLIDEAAFWSKAITDEECSWLYNGGYGFSLY